MSGETRILAELPNSFFGGLEAKIEDAVYHFMRHHHAQREDITLYIPEYIMRMWDVYLREQYMFSVSSGTPVAIREFKGMKILDNYENSIVIFMKEGVLRRINPIKFQIP